MTSDNVSTLATEESQTSPSSNVAILSQPTATVLLCSPKRTSRRTQKTQEANLTSTPLKSSLTVNLSGISMSPSRPKHVEPEHTKHKTAELYSTCNNSTSKVLPQRCHPRQAKQKVTTEQVNICHKSNGPPAKRGRVSQQKTAPGKRGSTERCRPRFELNQPDVTEQDRGSQDESLLSSDLSIELSHHEELLHSLSFQEEEDEEDEELPSFLMNADKKPSSVTEGAFAWCKFRNCPDWPAVVKRVNRKTKKASVVFIDDQMTHTKKGLSVALKTLKPFDCEEANELVCKAKEKYGVAIEWSLELITDYRMRIACGSFSGSFVEYMAHGMSYPVRRKYPQAASERLIIASDSFIEDQCDDDKEESFQVQQEEVRRSSKRLLPDRTHAAHNRANEKLVHFIVKQRMVDGHLLAVISGQQQSRWLHLFLSAKRRRVVNIYLEDEKQLDQVYLYLNELYATAVTTVPCVAELKSMERVPFILDVLLPEAIIYAIAGVDNVSVKKAEEKYLKGRCISNRERQEFDLMIEQHMKTTAHMNTIN
ncbi:PWWP domain-containing DNA repair factor 3B isoform X2 [Genypterus blacodes]